LPATDRSLEPNADFALFERVIRSFVLVLQRGELRPQLRVNVFRAA
jgi:hypothetical protein